jgi:hypothetical protein
MTAIIADSVLRLLTALLALATSLLVHSAASAQLFAFAPGAGETSYSVFSVDPVTGATGARLASGLPPATNAITYDPVGKRLFFRTISRELYTVHLDSGVVSHVPTATQGTLQFDAGRGVLLDLGFLPGETSYSVFEIDPTTGAHNAPVVSGLPGAANNITFDPVGHRLFFRTVARELYTVQVLSGSVSHVSVPTQGVLVFVELRGTLIDIGFNVGEITYSVAELNPFTGARSPAIVTGLSPYSSVTYDSRNARLLGFLSDLRVRTIALTDGTVGISPPVAVCCPSVFFATVQASEIPSLTAWWLLAMVVALGGLGLVRTTS